MPPLPACGPSGSSVDAGSTGLGLLVGTVCPGQQGSGHEGVVPTTGPPGAWLTGAQSQGTSKSPGGWSSSECGYARPQDSGALRGSHSASGDQAI